ncbi:hypothetical protein CUMW_155070, partial [Citrus unshiu]
MEPSKSPEKLLNPRYKNCSRVKLPIECGTLPQKPHDLRSNSFKELKFPVDHGNSPDNLLTEREIYFFQRMKITNGNRQLTP